MNGNLKIVWYQGKGSLLADTFDLTVLAPNFVIDLKNSKRRRLRATSPSIDDELSKSQLVDYLTWLQAISWILIDYNTGGQ